MRKDEAGGGTIFSILFSYCVIVTALFYLFYIFYQSTAVALEENIDNTMNEANLAAMTIDLDAFSYVYDDETAEIKVSPYLIDANKAFTLYKAVLSTNMNLNEEPNGEFTPNNNTRWNTFVSSIEILDFVLFDVVYSETGELVVSAKDINGWRELVFNKDTNMYELGNSIATPSYCPVEKLTTPNGIVVESPSVYSKLQLNIDSNVFGQKEYVRHNTTSIVVQ